MYGLPSIKQLNLSNAETSRKLNAKARDDARKATEEFSDTPGKDLDDWVDQNPVAVSPQAHARVSA